jgi:broad specificity phosphatase PhoE
LKFYLVRHGETEWNKLGKFQGVTDVTLNERGISQAMESAQAAADWGCSAIYSSPLSRTMRVAEEIGRLTSTPVVSKAGLMELSLGDLEGVTGEEMRRGWPEVYEAWRDSPEQTAMPNGESLAQLQERAWEAIVEIEEAHGDDESIVVVSHNFAIRTVICALVGVPLANFHRMSLSLGSLCTFEKDVRGRRLTAYNSTSHLSPENR